MHHVFINLFYLTLVGLWAGASSLFNSLAKGITLRPSPVGLILAGCYVLFVVTSLFFYNLPVWCAHPEVDVNQWVQPLCK